jgi:Lrp/AsnC family leucine-responsive transcriptional regulator
MDNTDAKILKLLQENSRINASQIGEQVNMSVSAVIERIRKLESAGIIKQYTTILDAKKLGKGTTAFISIRLEHPKYNESFMENVLNQSEIVECYYITGDYDYILKVVTASTESLANVLNGIKSIRGVALTRTVVVLSAVKCDASISPE